MKAAVDNTFLTLLLNPNAVPRPNPQTGKPVGHHRERIETMIDEISAAGGTLYIPSPVLAECLCSDGTIESVFSQLKGFAPIEVADFNSRAAYEFGRVIRDAKLNGDKRSGQVGEWQHVKMDRLIVAIAVSQSVDIFFSDDERQRNFAEMAGLKVKSTWDLDISPKHAQGNLQLEGGEDE